jgi:AraC-like DNA-binding protein
MPTDAVERLLRTLEVGLDAFAICEIEAGWRLTSAPMEADVVHFVLKGDGVLETDGAAFPIGPHTIVVVPAGAHKSIAGPGTVAHEVAAADACTLVTEGVVAIRAGDDRPDLVIACGAVSATYAGCYGLFEHLTEPLVERCPSLSPPFAMMLEELSRPGLGSRVMAEALMKQCLILLLRDHMDRFGVRSPLFGPLIDTRLARAVAAVIAQPAYPHSVKSLSATAGMSRSSFSARFQASYEQTPLEFVQAVRLRTAARLLQTSELPVKSVAAAIGYSSRSHFSRAFRNAYGVDPSGYRAEPAPSDSAEARQPPLLGASRAARVRPAPTERRSRREMADGRRNGNTGA